MICADPSRVFLRAGMRLLQVGSPDLQTQLEAFFFCPRSGKCVPTHHYVGGRMRSLLIIEVVLDVQLDGCCHDVSLMMV